ncbi:hypothetical protein J6590_050392 [Homalodisca vitripennis]|nr:hypothetical protein J6590_050392 [Homalodisca vitripennis]
MFVSLMSKRCNTSFVADFFVWIFSDRRGLQIPEVKSVTAADCGKYNGAELSIHIKFAIPSTLSSELCIRTTSSSYCALGGYRNFNEMAVFFMGCQWERSLSDSSGVQTRPFNCKVLQPTTSPVCVLEISVFLRYE